MNPLRRILLGCLACLAASAVRAADDVTVSGTTTYSGTTTVQANNSITTSGTVTVASGGNVTYNAGARVTLGAGFSVASGGAFHITIGQNLPYSIGFESADGFSTGSVGGQRGWILTQGAADVVTSAYYGGSRSLALQSGSSGAIVSQGFQASGSPSVSFLDLYVLPVAASSAASSTLIQTDSIKIGFQTASGLGEVYAFDGVGANQWIAEGFRFAINGSNQATSWLHLTIRTDYTHHKWDLWVNGVLVDYDLATANTTETFLRSLTLTGTASAASYVDNILAQEANPLFTDADKDGMDDAWESAHGLSTSTDDRNSDHDGDGQTNIEEYFAGTDPNNADVTAPTAPTVLKIDSTAPTSIKIKWSGAADTGAGTHGIAGYNVYRGGVQVNSSLVTSASYTDSTVSAGNTYGYTIRVVDLAGNVSSSSASLSVTTDAASSSGSFEVLTPLP